MILALAGARKYHIGQLDIKSAYLHTYLDTPVYMEQPPMHRDPEKTNYICKLICGLYGLHVSRLLWNKTLDNYLKTRHLYHLEDEPCLYICHDPKQGFLALTIYVDDILICAEHESEKKDFIKIISAKFPTKDIGFPASLLGYSIAKTSKGCISLCQAGYIKELIQSYHQTNGRETHYAILGEHLEQALSKDIQQEPCDPTVYSQVIGCLNWIAKNSRADISFVVSMLARYMAKPNMHQYEMLMHVLCYLNTYPNEAIIHRPGPTNIIAYSDANYVNMYYGDGKSTSEFVIFMAGGLIDRSAKKQTTTALSSCESEYMAMSECVQRVAYISQNLDGIAIDTGRVPLFADNASAVRLLREMCPQQNPPYCHQVSIYQGSRNK